MHRRVWLHVRTKVFASEGLIEHHIHTFFFLSVYLCNSMLPLSVYRDIASAIKEVLDAVNEVSKKHQTDTRMKEYKKVRVQLAAVSVWSVSHTKTSSAVGNVVD